MARKKKPLADVFPVNLATWRSHAGISQLELARRAGVSVSFISMLERGQRTPALPTVDAIAAGLKVDRLLLLDDRAA